MMADQLLRRLERACTSTDSAIRMSNHLVPAGGPADKVFPPTYAGKPESSGKSGPVYAEEERLIEGVNMSTVLVDSVQSQANRMEESILRAFDRGRCPLPVLEVNVGGVRVTSLDAPHRAFDAIFRDSELDGVAFRQSPMGQAIINTTMRNATALYQHAPTVLIFGGWDSHGLENKGLGIKIPRILTSEFIGIGTVPGKKTGGRIDPLGIRANAGPIVKIGDDWELATDTKGKKGLLKPSEIGHGNVAPSVQEAGGVSVSDVRQIAVVALPQLRRLHFPDPDTGEVNEQRDVAGRVVLAALALYALALQDEDGYWLRARCHLVPKGAAHYEIIGRTAGEREPFRLDANQAYVVFQRAYQEAAATGLSWQAGTVKLMPSAKLSELVNRSQAIGGTEDDE